MIELQTKHYDVIMDCLEEFDFERVHEVMFALDWRYADSGNVPSTQHLRKNARQYLQEVIVGALHRKDQDGEYIIGTGGFRYECKIYPDDFVWVRMSFTIEDWDNAE